MRGSGMNRMRRVLAAAKQAELLQLGRADAAMRAARQRAQDLRESARLADPVETASDMIALGAWQAHAEACARAAEAEAREIEKEVEVLQERLSRTLGRETVVEGLIRRAEADARQVSERRAEDRPLSRSSPGVGIGSSTAGIA